MYNARAVLLAAKLTAATKSYKLFRYEESTAKQGQEQQR